MDTVVPRVPKRLHHLRLVRDVIPVAVLHVRGLCRRLPVGVELDPVGRVEIDHLHFAAQRFVFREGRHDLQRIAENQAVLPPFLVVVEPRLHIGVEPFHTFAELHLRLRGVLADRRPPLHLLDEHAREDLLLLVDDRRLDLQLVEVAAALAAPDVLRVEVRIARGEFGRQIRPFPAERILHGLYLTHAGQVLRRDAGVFARRQLRTRILLVHRIVGNLGPGGFLGGILGHTLSFKLLFRIRPAPAHRRRGSFRATRPGRRTRPSGNRSRSARRTPSGRNASRRSRRESTSPPWSAF